MSIDLHLHTTYSDGRLTPSQLVHEAARLGLRAIAITDHDVVGGISEATEAGRRLGIEVVPGIELTCDWQGRTAHLLGYFFNPTSPQLLAALHRGRTLMDEHVVGVVNGLAAEGHVLAPQELQRYRARYVSGASLILAMLERGILRRSPRARYWLRLAGREPRAYTLGEGIQLIHAAGGLASLAHPVRLLRGKPLLEAADLAPMVADGLDALEVWQFTTAPAVRDHYQRLAAELGLQATGGSDWHGSSRGDRGLGRQHIPYELLSEMRRILACRLQAAPSPGRS